MEGLGLCLNNILSTCLILSVGGGQALPAPSGPSSSSSWTEDSFEMRVLLEPFSEMEMESQGPSSVNQPSVTPPVASRGEEAGPSNRAPPKVSYPYHEDEMIGGDSVLLIQHRLLATDPSPSATKMEFTRIQAEDLFEVKVDIIFKMSVLNPEGDWFGQGARALENSRTRTGEESLEKLHTLLSDLKAGGVNSEAFSQLKGRVPLQRAGDEHSTA